MGIMARRYQEAGGTVSNVYNTLCVLEKIYPLDILENARVKLQYGYNPKGSNIVVIMNQEKPTLYLLKDKWDWQRHRDECMGYKLAEEVAMINGLASYNVSLEFHIALTLAHEWGHLIQTAYKSNANRLLPLEYLLDKEEDAEKWAWKFMIKYWQSILPLSEMPEIIQLKLRPSSNPSPNDQLSLDLEASS